MKNVTKLIAAAALLGGLAGGVLTFTSGASQAGLKDDTCWIPRQVNIKDQIHNRSCIFYGQVEPNNGERGASATSTGINVSGGTRNNTPASPTPPSATPPSATPTTDTPSSPTPPEAGCTTNCNTDNPPPPPPVDTCETRGDCVNPPPPPPPPPEECTGKKCDPKPPKEKSNRGYGNGEEASCNGKDCFANDPNGGERDNTGKGPGRK